MSIHRFRIGQSVRLKARTGLSPKAAESYKIMATLPPLNNSPQYRIRSEHERHERVATEDNLEATGGVFAKSATAAR